MKYFVFSEGVCGKNYRRHSPPTPLSDFMPIKKDPRSRWDRIEGLQVGFACLTINVSLNHF